ncbi:hypothetical protein AVEN_16386-1 [Araneus ventricosus]|uniref:Uncharacterized protein n=1 Tax=Araneus ventricosus TaxID=182803 RepID=A0A4Y2U1R9_ARAVE|nr:hypothetical protein AVEN_16386-1 [Araneus ventricosus]
MSLRPNENSKGQGLFKKTNIATLIRMVIHIEITSNTHQSDSRCDSLSSEARSLMAFTATGRTLPLEALTITGRVQDPTIIVLTRKRDPAYLSGGF